LTRIVSPVTRKNLFFRTLRKEVSFRKTPARRKENTNPISGWWNDRRARDTYSYTPLRARRLPVAEHRSGHWIAVPRTHVTGHTRLGPVYCISIWTLECDRRVCPDDRVTRECTFYRRNATVHDLPPRLIFFFFFFFLITLTTFNSVAPSEIRVPSRFYECTRIRSDIIINNRN